MSFNVLYKRRKHYSAMVSVADSQANGLGSILAESVNFFITFILLKLLDSLKVNYENAKVWNFIIPGIV